MNNYKIVILSLLLVAVTSVVSAQQAEHLGEVSFMNANNVYVRFASTESINVGDTLFISGASERIPCLLVTNKSSSSCVCVRLNNCALTQKDAIHHYPGKITVSEEAAPEDMIPEEETDIPETVPVEADPSEVLSNPMFKGNFRARVSAASYSSLSPEVDDDRHRTMFRFSMNAQNIDDSRISFETYVNYRQNFLQGEVPANYETKFFRIYNFALTYDVDSSMHLTLGRKINRKIASIGAIDGLQVEKAVGSLYLGAVAGFRPDISAFDFNRNLFEYGGFLGLATSNRAFLSETTLGFMEQQNSGSVDRRYAFFQHRSTIGRRLSLYGSAEVDIYSNVNGTVSSSPRLTSFYGSARFKFGRRLTLTAAYDNRRRIIYYETFRTEVEKILADDEARQGLRLRLNIRPMNYVNLGVSVGRRFQNSNQNKSDNINAYISHSRLPLINGSITLRANWNRSNYLDSRIASIRIAKNLIPKKLQGQVYYRLVQYNYLNSELSAYQQYYGASLYLRLSKTLRFTLAGEMNMKRDERYYNINTKLIKRF